MRIVISLIDGSKVYFNNSSMKDFDKMTTTIECGQSIKADYRGKKRNVFAHAVVSIEID